MKTKIRFLAMTLIGVLLSVNQVWATDDVLTANDFEATTTQYKGFSGVSKSSDAVYAGNSAKSSSGAIQIRTTNSNSGIVSTGSGGNVTKVTIVWGNDNVNERYLEVYGKNSTYSSAADLYDDATRGTSLGTITYYSTSAETELSISDSYQYIGLRSHDGALYITSVTISWGSTTTYTDYLTECAPSYSITNHLTNVTADGGNPTSVTAADDNVTLNYTASTGYILPANITVKMGDATLVKNTDYTWEDGELMIMPDGGFTGNLDITIAGQTASYEVTLDKNNHATTDGAILTEYLSTETYFTAVTGITTGYTLNGYYTAASGGYMVVDTEGVLQANVSGWTNSDGQWIRTSGEMKLYAQYSPIEYTLTYEGLEGATHTNPAKYTIESAAITLTDPSARAGFTFAGWTCGGSPITTIATGSTGNKTITATWTALVPSITAHPASATYTVGDDAAVLSVTATLASGTLGHQWQSSSDNSNWNNIGGATSSSYKPSTSSAGITYYRCVVSNATAGSGSATSGVATITVKASTVKYHIFVCPADVWGSSYDGNGVSINYQKTDDSWSGVQAMILTGFNNGGKVVYGYEMDVNPNTSLKTLQFVNHGDYYGAGDWGNSNDHMYKGDHDGHQWADIPATSNASAVYLVGSFNGWVNADANYALTRVDNNHYKGTFVLNGASSNYEFKVYAVDLPSTWGYQFSGNGYWFNNDNTTATQLWSNNSNDQIVPFAASGRFLINVEYFGNYDNHGQLTVTRTALPQVTYAKGGSGDVTGTDPASASYAPDEQFDLPDNPYTRNGYTFAGWNDGTSTYAAGATYTMGSSNVTLTAQWTPINYDITYTNTKSVEHSNPTTYTIESETIEFVALSNVTGYTFTAWSPASITKGSTGGKTINATWALVNYTITYKDKGDNTFSGTGWSGMGTHPDSYTIESSTITLDTPTKDGYTFGGWYLDVACSTSPISAIASGSHENKTLYAKWNTVTYTLTYDNLQGASNTNPSSYTIETNTITLVDPGERADYNFTGWTCGGDAITQITQGSTGDKTIVANWTAKTYHNYRTLCCTAPANPLEITGTSALTITASVAEPSTTLSTTGGNDGTVVWNKVTESDNYSITSGGVFSATKKGTYTVSASQAQNGDYCAQVAEFTVTVSADLKSIAVEATKTKFTQNEAFSFAGTITATYEDNSQATINKDQCTFTGYDMATLGEQTVTVSYTENTIEKTTTYTITVNAEPTWTITLDPGTGRCNQSTVYVVTQKNPKITLNDCTLDNCPEYGEKSFVGWSETPVNTETTTAPTLVEHNPYTATQDITLYAVYKKTVSSGAEETITNVGKKTNPTGRWKMGGFDFGYNTTFKGKTIQDTVSADYTKIESVTFKSTSSGWGSGASISVVRVKKSDNTEVSLGTFNTQLSANATGTLNISSANQTVAVDDIIKFTGGGTGNSFLNQVSISFKKTVSTSYYYSLPCGSATTAITLKPNYSGGVAGSATATLNSSTITNFSGVARSNANLLGYYSATDGTDKVMTDAGALVANSTCTDADGKWKKAVATLDLYAHWDYNVTYDSNGGSENPTALTHVTALPDPLPSAGTNGELKFMGWYFDKGTWAQPATAGQAITSNATLAAKWLNKDPGTVTISGTYHCFPGENISLTATAEYPERLLPEATYTWKKGGVTIEGQTSATLTINSCTVSDAGKYTCTITNEGKESTSAEYGVKILQFYQKNASGTDLYNAPLIKVDATTAYIELDLDGNITYKFRLTDGCNNWYGNTGTMTSSNCSNWPMDADADCSIQTTKTGKYRFNVNYSDLAHLTVSVIYPSGNQAAGINIYFDNTRLNWSADKINYRIGKTDHNNATLMTLVPGTANFYKITTATYDNFAAWHIANNACWSGSNSIYKTKTGDGYAATEAMSFIGDAVLEDATFALTDAHAKGGDDQNNNCDFYTYIKTTGMLTHNVAITAPTNGTITVNYTDVNNDAQVMTSGNADLAHTCILTISAAGATHYDLATLTVNGAPFTSGQTLTLTEDITIAATFTAHSYAIAVTQPDFGSITAPTNGASVAHGQSVNLTFSWGSLYSADYSFDGWSVMQGETPVVVASPTSTNTSFTMPTGDVTVTATVTEKPKYTVTFHVNGATTVLTEEHSGSGVTPPATGTIGDYSFWKWSTQDVTPETTTVPSNVTLVDGKYYPTANIDIYAVYTVNKNARVYGYIFSTVKDETRYYLAARSGTNTYFGANSSKSSAQTLYIDGQHLYYVSGNTNYYFYNENSAKADLTFQTSKASANLWTITTTDGVTTIKNTTTNRYLAYNSRFAGYLDNASYPHNLLMEQSEEYIEKMTPHYWSYPVAEATPSVSFVNPTTTVACDASVKNVVTTNSTGAVTYSSSDDAIATVASDGTVTGHKYGTVTITANVAAVTGVWKAGSASYSINVTRLTPTLEWPAGGVTTIYADNVYTWTATTNSDATITYSSTNETRGKMDEDGILTGGKASDISSSKWSGTLSFTIRATVAQTDKYEYKQILQSIAVKDNRKDQTVVFDPASYNFNNGATVIPFINTFAEGKTPKTSGVTYESNNTNVATVVANTGEVSVPASVGHAGTATITATVPAGAVVDEGIKFEYAATTASYTITVGKAAANVAATQESVAYRVYIDDYVEIAPYFTKSTTADLVFTLPDMTTGAEIEDGYFSATQAGTYTVTATAAENEQYLGGSATIQFICTDSRVPANLVFNTTAETIGVMRDLNVYATSDFPSETITYTLTPDDNAIYDEETHTFYAEEAGTYTLTANIAGTATHTAGEATCTITVTDERVSPNLQFDRASYTVYINVYTVTVHAESKSDPKSTGAVTYSTVNDYGKTCTVNATTGEVYAYSPGTYYIKADIAATADHKAQTVQCSVIVLDQKSSNLQLWVDGDSRINLKYGNTITVNHSVATGYAGTVTYAIAPTKGASYNESTGVFTFSKVGNYTLSGNAPADGDFVASTHAVSLTAYEIRVYYDKHGATSGSNFTDPNYYEIGDLATVMSASSLSKTGYRFSHWNTSADDTGTRYDVGDDILIESEAGVTLYAQWKQQYSFTYANIDETDWYSTECGNTIMVDENATVNITTGTPVRSGYEFAGWFDALDGGNAYTAGAPLTITANTTVYAHWNAVTTWQNDMLGAVHTTTTAVDGKVVLPTGENPVACTGYAALGWTFYGWGESIDGYKSAAPTIVDASTAATTPKTYYAIFVNSSNNKWRTQCIGVNSVTYKANGGEGDDYVQYTEGTTATAIDVATAGFTKTGSSFIGWSLEGDESGTLVQPGATISGISGNANYNAVWMGTLSITGDVKLTASAGQTAGTASTGITFSSSDMSCVTALRITYYDVTNDITYGRTGSPLYNQSEFRLCNSLYNVADGSNIDLSEVTGAYNQTYSITYTPNGGANTRDHYQMKVEVLYKNTVVATVNHDMYGRTLPEKFVIATQKDGKWYALPANMNGANTYAGTEIIVSGAGQEMVAYAADTTNYTMKTYNYNKNKVLFQSLYNEGHLWAATSGNTGINNNAKAISGQNVNYEWTLTPDGDMWVYQMLNENNERYLRLYGTNYGMYNSGVNDLYFLPVENITSLTMNVVEWFPTKVLVEVKKPNTEFKTENVTVKIDGKDVAATTVSDNTYGKYLYEIKGLDLVNNAMKQLLITYTHEAVSYGASVNIPIILSRVTKNITDEPFSTWGSSKYNNADLVLRDSARLTANGTQPKQHIFQNVTIYPTAKLVIPTSTYGFTANGQITLRGGKDEIYDGSKYEMTVYGAEPQLCAIGRLWHPNKDTIYYEKRVDLTRMYQVSLPDTVPLSDITYLDGTTIAPGSALFAETWDGQAKVEGKQYWKYEDTFNPAQFTMGVGYTVSAVPQHYPDQKYTIIRFPMDRHQSGDFEGGYSEKIHVTKWGEGTKVSTIIQGWNYIGNPYMTAMQGEIWIYPDDSDDEEEYKVLEHITYMSEDGTMYKVGVPEDTKLLPFRSFFVQVPCTGNLRFSTNRPLDAPARKKTLDDLIKFQLYLQQGKIEDNATMKISDSYNDTAYVIGPDYGKMLTGEEPLAVFIIDKGGELADDAITSKHAKDWIPIGYIASNTNEMTYTLDIKEGAENLKHVYLKDMGNKEQITDLLIDDYVFTPAQKGRIDNRFYISVEVGNVTTNIDGASGEYSNKIRKFVYEDKLFIEKNGVIYDATGKRVKL